MECEHLFRGKRITLMGLGLLGRGVGDAAFLARCGATLTVTDKKTAEELAPSLEALKGYPGITFHLGGHRIEDFSACDMVIKGAGVPLDSPEIAVARSARVPVYMSTALFAKYAMEAGAQVVGVTGTRGKSTVVQMMHEVLARVHKRVFLGGNVRGISTLALLPLVRKGDVAVLELDSWQLQGFGDLGISPHVAIFTNFMPDHQNYYKNMDEYFTDKANIFRYQKDGDILVHDPDLAERINQYRPAANVYRVQPRDPLEPEWCPHLLGEHNLYNAALASAALEAMGILRKDVRAGLASFKPVEGRLQFVREHQGVRIYNDNSATTPEATVAALKALGLDIALIVGGSDKGLALDDLVTQIRVHCSHVVLLTHENYGGSVRLAEALKAASTRVEEAASLSEAIQAALAHKDVATLLFSPAFASFGMFRNEYERNDEFMRLARALS